MPTLYVDRENIEHLKLPLIGGIFFLTQRRLAIALAITGGAHEQVSHPSVANFFCRHALCLCRFGSFT